MKICSWTVVTEETIDTGRDNGPPFSQGTIGSLQESQTSSEKLFLCSGREPLPLAPLTGWQVQGRGLPREGP